MNQLKMDLVVEMDLGEVVEFVSLLAAVPVVIWILIKLKMRVMDVGVRVMVMGMWVIDNFSDVINIIPSVSIYRS